MRSRFGSPRRRPRADASQLNSALLRRVPDIVSNTQGEDTVLLDLAAGQYHALNDVGTRVWELLETGATCPQIVRVVRAEYTLPPDAPDDQVERDILALLVRLADAGLIAVERAP